MRSRLTRFLFVSAGLFLLWNGAAYGAGLSETEVRKIETLIASVERLTDARFIRNGKAYSAKDAGRFLRGKWRAREAEVGSADDFIAKVASFSSTTGQPYRIRFPDGREIPAAEFLRAELARNSRKAESR